MDEGSDKKPVWAAAMPLDAYKAALLKIIPNDASDPITRKVLEKALLNAGFDNPTKALIFDRDPDAFIEAVLDKWQNTTPTKRAPCRVPVGQHEMRVFVTCRAVPLRERGEPCAEQFDAGAAIYSAYARIRKSLGEMTRKLSDTASQ